MDIKNRIEKLEKKAKPEKRGKIYIVVNKDLKNEGEKEEDGESWSEEDLVIIVGSEKAKELTKRVLAGEGT